MERKYYKHEKLDANAPIKKDIDDMYNYYYYNDEQNGLFAEITEEEAEELEKRIKANEKM